MSRAFIQFIRENSRLWREFKARAILEGRPLKELIREAIREYLDRHPLVGEEEGEVR